MPDSYALVYRRPDGWWLAGHGWLSVEEARKDGEGHNWLGAAWGVVNSADVVDIDGDQRLPIGREPTLHLVEHGAYFPEVEGARRVLSAAKKVQPVVAAVEHERSMQRLYLLLAFFDARDGSPLADLVRAAREGCERSHQDMAESGAWDEFDARWEKRPDHAPPVVALPPCPTCEGTGYDDPPGAGDYAEDMSPPMRCIDCNGSGVERLVPVSEIVAWLRQAPHGHHFGDDPNDQGYAMHGRDWFADEIERRFAGMDASTEHRKEAR